MRKFYLAYRDRISETTYRKFALEKSETASRIFEEQETGVGSLSPFSLMKRIDL